MPNELLNDIQVPTEAIEFTNSKCDSHTYDIELFHDQIINACLSASRHTLCQPKSKNNKHVTDCDIDEVIEVMRYSGTLFEKNWGQDLGVIIIRL